MTVEQLSAPPYSVVIIGAGPTGLVLANFLGKAGVRTLLVEEDAATVREPRAVSIDDESLRTLQALGLLDAVMRDVVPGYGSQYRTAAGRVFLTISPREQPYGHPRRNAFRQPDLEAQLLEGLGRFPCVDVRFSCRAESFDEREEEVTVRLRFVHDDSVSTTRTQYLVACDGARSTIRQSLGIPLSGTSFNERWLILDLNDSPALSRDTIVFCNPTRPCIALPGPNLTRRYEFKLLRGERDADMLSDENVARLLAEHEANPSSTLVRKTIYRFHARMARHWRRGRVLLAGDAAHLTPPFAGQGMNSGIRDAHNLSWKLAHVVNGRFGSALLDTYEQERRSHTWDMIRLALRMGSIMAPRTRLHAWFTQALFRLLGISPSIRQFLAEMKYKPSPRFRSGFFTGRRFSGSAIIGRQIPQPSIGGVGSGNRRLDDLLGDGFVLFGIDIDETTVTNVSLGERWDRLIERRIGLPLSAVPEFAIHRGKFLLIRPDKYVLARWSPTETPTMACVLTRMWLNTWTTRDLRGGPSNSAPNMAKKCGSDAPPDICPTSSE